MSVRTLVAVVVTFFWILPTAGQTDRTGISLVDEFKNSRPFFKQIEIGKQIIALRDPGLLENLKDMLVSEDRHVRANTAFVFAGLGDVRGLQIIANILQDRSDRPEGQARPRQSRTPMRRKTKGSP